MKDSGYLQGQAFSGGESFHPEVWSSASVLQVYQPVLEDEIKHTRHGLEAFPTHPGFHGGFGQVGEKIRWQFHGTTLAVEFERLRELRRGGRRGELSCHDPGVAHEFAVMRAGT